MEIVVCSQVSAMTQLDTQPFGVSVPNSDSSLHDKILVTCSTPLRHGLPLFSNSSAVHVIDADSGKVDRIIQLSDSYEIPRHAVSLGNLIYVCHGWTKPGKVWSPSYVLTL